MRWITRERPKIDRIACPWLVTRFVDAQPEFLYVPGADVMRIAQETGATPYCATLHWPAWRCSCAQRTAATPRRCPRRLDCWPFRGACR